LVERRVLVKLLRHDGSHDYCVLDEEQVERVGRELVAVGGDLAIVGEEA